MRVARVPGAGGAAHGEGGGTFGGRGSGVGGQFFFPTLRRKRSSRGARGASNGHMQWALVARWSAEVHRVFKPKKKTQKKDPKVLLVLTFCINMLVCPSPFPSALTQRGDSCPPLPRVDLIQKVSTKRLNPARRLVAPFPRVELIQKVSTNRPPAPGAVLPPVEPPRVPNQYLKVASINPPHQQYITRQRMGA